VVRHRVVSFRNQVESMNPIQTSRHSIVSLPEGGLRFTATVRDHRVATDQPVRLGGDDTAPTPLELLSVSLASCVALYARHYLDSRQLEAEELAVEVKPVWRDDPGRISRFDVTVHVPAGLCEEDRTGLEAQAQSCPVHHTLAMAPEITFQLRDLARVEVGTS
jgi:putative redox protein